MKSFARSQELPVLFPFFPAHSTHAGLSAPNKRAFSLFNREKGAWVEMGRKKGTRKGKKIKTVFNLHLID
jgi:hypothetical protein